MEIIAVLHTPFNNRNHSSWLFCFLDRVLVLPLWWTFPLYFGLVAGRRESWEARHFFATGNGTTVATVSR